VIYLDNAATSFPKPECVYEEVYRCMKEYGANPGRSGHKLSLRAGRVIYETRELLCQLFNISNPMRLIFTSNATDSLNLAIKGVLMKGDHVITSSMEHNSVLRPIKALEAIGVENTIVRCQKDGSISVEDIEKAIKENTKLIVITHASNVVGTLMPIKEIGKMAREKKILFLVDASQTAGLYDIDVEDMNIDLLAFPGHKSLLGPQGTGGLYIREGINLRQMKEGGTGSKSESLYQPDLVPDRYESGTANTPGIAGLGAGVKYILEKGIENIRKHEEELTEYFLKGLKTIDNVIIYGPQDHKKQGPVVSINIGDYDSSEISYILDKEYDIAVRSGLHCAPLAHETLGTLERGAIRFSFGCFNTKEEIDRTLEAIEKIAREIS